MSAHGIGINSESGNVCGSQRPRRGTDDRVAAGDAIGLHREPKRKERAAAAGKEDARAGSIEARDNLPVVPLAAGRVRCSRTRRKQQARRWRLAELDAAARAETSRRACGKNSFTSQLLGFAKATMPGKTTWASDAATPGSGASSQSRGKPSAVARATPAAPSPRERPMKLCAQTSAKKWHSVHGSCIATRASALAIHRASHANAVLEMVCTVHSDIVLSEAAAIASISGVVGGCIDSCAKDLAVSDQFCAVSCVILGMAAEDIAAISVSCRIASVAQDHAVLARCFEGHAEIVGSEAEARA
eukprot:NODE_13556_length_1159_cov_3.502907.p2 GENE.NODE_13556_length_1159_cov_3.502907~~NODE_13556_length_1159_cov_3.502907.p2  ORF type:complete len:302 (+),score=32.49 NODE_13556_length_1159_cov_3.502907:199-1104(+)